MKYFVLAITFIIPLSSLNAAMYKVQKGDSLWDISNKFKVSMSTLRKINDFYGDNLRIGQQLFIPDLIENYTVKQGDTYDSIAKKFNTKTQYIIVLNNISENHTVAGQVLKIPVEKKVSQIEEIKTSTEKTITYTPIVYKVKKGDTLSDVALKYRTTVPALRQLNKKNSSQIYVGERLIVGNRAVTPAQATNASSSKTNETAAPSGTKIVHNVARGQHLDMIAKRYNVTISDLRKWNNKTSSTLYVGEKLTVYTDRLPSTSTTTNKTAPATTKVVEPPKDSYRTINYIVKKGDHLLLIAAKFGVKATDLKKWNKKSSDRLYVGERIQIRIPKLNTAPAVPPKNSNTKLLTYKVKRGDTLGDIALKYKVSTTQIRSWNKKGNSRVYVGENLKIYTTVKTTTTKTKVSTKPVKRAPSKGAQYTSTSRITGIKSNRFNDVALPIRASQILQTSSSGRGIDIKLRSELPLKSPTAGKISYAGYINALKNVIIMDLSNDRTIVYAGLDNLHVSKGDEVKAGQALGVVGKYSNQDNPTLYMELRDRKKVANAFHTYQVLAAKRKDKK
ncbi:MAG: LysM peptidoglycan-binding domain-containing protein [Brevinema sp.]